MTCQWPLGIEEEYLKSLPLEDLKRLYEASSSSVSALIDLLQPRYIYSSQLDLHHKPLPYVSPLGHLSRFIALGSIPGKHKPADSKQVYIQALEIEPLTSIADTKDLLPGDGVEHRPHSPFHLKLAKATTLSERIQLMLEWRLTIGADIVK